MESEGTVARRIVANLQGHQLVSIENAIDGVF